jgi:hypothetical protein
MGRHRVCYPLLHDTALLRHGHEDVFTLNAFWLSHVFSSMTTQLCDYRQKYQIYALCSSEYFTHIVTKSDIHRQYGEESLRASLNYLY